MKIFYDTEFIEDGRTIDLISIGMIREDGAALYLENSEANYAAASDWVKENVLPFLNHSAEHHTTRAAIAEQVRTFCEVNGEKPELWAYYCSYDHVALCQLFGRMVDLPEGWPYFTRDIKQLAVSLGNPRLPARDTAEHPEHHALADAIWTRDAWVYLMKIWDTERAGQFPSGYSKEPMLTASQWLMVPEFQSIAVIDPDGWRSAGRLWDDRLTKAEFQQRLLESSVLWRPSYSANHQT